MALLFGLAGFVEVIDEFMLMIAYGGTLVLLGIALFALRSRQRYAMVVALVLAIPLGGFFFPMELFVATESADPDVHHSAANWRTFGVFWFFTMTITVIAALRTHFFPMLPEKSHENLETKSNESQIANG